MVLVDPLKHQKAQISYKIITLLIRRIFPSPTRLEKSRQKFFYQTFPFLE